MAGKLLDSLAKILFQRFGDSGEGCREMSLKLTALLVQATPDLARHLPYLFPAMTGT